MAIIDTLITELEVAKQSKAYNKELVKKNKTKTGNEFLAILKPEVFCYTSKTQITDIFNLVIERFNQFDLQVDNVRMLNASFLSEYDTIANHYGIINAIAKDVKGNITNEAINKFHDIYKEDFGEVEVFGALELLEGDNNIDKDILADLWKDCTIQRLAGGIYCGEVTYNKKKLYILNGFHPPQLAHFIEKERVIVTMNVSGNLDWQKARKELIGNTYPEKAEKGTIRRDLYDIYGKMGFDDVSYVINSIHLSAGPLEGLIELMRFNNLKMESYLFGQQLSNSFNKEICEKILLNPIVNYNGTEISLFDLTEEKNSYEAIEILKEVFL